MDGQREPQAFRWEPKNDDDLIYIEEQARELVYGDIVQVDDGQVVRFGAAGKYWWIRENGIHTIGYDKRSQAEILLANMMGEELGGLPMLVNTSLVFCSLKKQQFRVEAPEYIKINRMIGLKPVFQATVHVADEEKLFQWLNLNCAASGQILEILSRILDRVLKEQLSEAGIPSECTTPGQVRNALENKEQDWKILEALKAALAESESYGISVDELDLVDWTVWSGFCEVCGERVSARDRRCPNRHVLYRCPECRELIYDGKCLVNGHDVLMCPDCGGYVIPKDGQCPVHRIIKR